MSARVALLRMERDGLITLPPARPANFNVPIPRFTEPIPELQFELPVHLEALGQIQLNIVKTKAHLLRWRNLISSYHYLGHVPFAGAQLRYLIECSYGTLGALGFAASAWKCAPRDIHIGWDSGTREARLQLVVGNARFLILPHVRIQNFASYILSRVTKRLPDDWKITYGYEPVLLETFVESNRFSGASYKAAN